MSGRLDLLHPRVIQAIQQHGLIAEVMECDPNLADTAAFCEHYKFSPDETCNAIIVAGKTEPIMYACCVVLANQKLDVNKKVSQLLEIKRCSFASGDQTIAATGMQIGGVTPVGIEDMPIYVDATVENKPRVVLGGGNRSTKLLVKPFELTKIPHLQFINHLGLPR